ncbi:MAG: hypothetical protein RIG82_05970 [Phycisphaeraceae bacterium]
MRQLPTLLLALCLAALPACESTHSANPTTWNWDWVPTVNLALGNNVTDDPAFRVGYVPGDIYQTQQDLVMIKPDGWNGDIYLVGYATSPGELTAAETYAANPNSYKDVRGVLAKGTRLQIEELIRYGEETEEIDNDADDESEDSDANHNDADDDEEITITRRAFVRVFAEILDGPLRGKTVILDKASREDDFPQDSTGFLPDRQVMLKAN